MSAILKVDIGLEEWEFEWLGIEWLGDMSLSFIALIGVQRHQPGVLQIIG